MEIANLTQSREEYFQTQVDRSNEKFWYCKVSLKHVRQWKSILRASEKPFEGPILCLGTRNGREIDLFRAGFRANAAYQRLLLLNERERNGWNPYFRTLEGFGRSDSRRIEHDSVVGVEINPQAARCDTHIGSFDEMPQEWGGKFKVIYSNSFDQSQDPYKTAKEWKRIMAPGSFAIIGFSPDTAPTESDPVGRLTYADFTNLFGGELIYYNKFGSQYQDVILYFA